MEPKRIPNFEDYMITEKGVVINVKTGKTIPSKNGKVRLYDRPKHKVAHVVNDLIKMIFSNKKTGKNGMSDKIRQLYKEGLSIKEISDKIMPNIRYVRNVIYEMNFKENKKAIIEDLKKITQEEIQKKYNIAPRFIKNLASSL